MKTKLTLSSLEQMIKIYGLALETEAGEQKKTIAVEKKAKCLVIGQKADGRRNEKPSGESVRRSAAIGLPGRMSSLLLNVFRSLTLN